MASDDLGDPRLTAMGLLIEVFEGVNARIDAVHQSHGHSSSDFDVLIRLARSPGEGLRMTDLALQTSMSTSGVTRVVDRLEGRELVRRTTCPNDRRSLLVELTPHGVERVSSVLPELLEAIDRWFTGVLEPPQLDDLLEALRRIRDTVRPDAAAGAEGPAAS